MASPFLVELLQDFLERNATRDQTFVQSNRRLHVRQILAESTVRGLRRAKCHPKRCPWMTFCLPMATEDLIFLWLESPGRENMHNVELLALKALSYPST